MSAAAIAGLQKACRALSYRRIGWCAMTYLTSVHTFMESPPATSMRAFVIIAEMRGDVVDVSWT